MIFQRTFEARTWHFSNVISCRKSCLKLEPLHLSHRFSFCQSTMALSLSPAPFTPSHLPREPTHHVHRDVRPRVHIRRATLGDLDSILKIGLAAMPLDPQWNWRFSNRFQYPDDHVMHTKATYQSFLENPARWRVTVAELRSSSSRPKLVAFAIWDYGVLGHMADPTKGRITSLTVHQRQTDFLL